MRRLLLVAAVLAPSTAFAHISLVSPTPRTTEQKSQVCGGPGTTRANVTTLAPGATITVVWKETIDHPGHYRISFDDDGQDFPIPATNTPGATNGMPTVMVDPIADIQGALPAGGREYSQQITLPNIECTNCTLQLFQMMTDKPPYSTDAASNDIYYQCADIVLSNTPQPPPPDAGVPGDDAGVDPSPNGDLSGGGCSTGGGAGGGAALLAFGFVVLRRRKR